MSNPGSAPGHRVLLVESDEQGGRVLEGGLVSRGWEVNRFTHAETLPAGVLECDVALLVLDDDDIGIFELLIWLAAQPRHPAVVLLSRRADARMLEANVLHALGVDRLVAWPCRIDQLSAELASAQPPHQPLRLVS